MNKIFLSGIITGQPELSHEVFGEKFYRFYIASSRKSGIHDVIPCIISEIIMNNIKVGENIKIYGEIRTRNVSNDEKRHLEVYAFVNEILEYGAEDENFVEINGFVCKEGILRDTPLGRQVADIIIASNRERNFKSDYIPCIAWGRNAVKSSIIKVGTEVNIFGRLQSREYTKKFDDGTEEIRIAYEVSSISVNEVSKERKCEE